VAYFDDSTCVIAERWGCSSRASALTAEVFSFIESLNQKERIHSVIFSCTQSRQYRISLYGKMGSLRGETMAVGLRRHMVYPAVSANAAAARRGILSSSVVNSAIRPNNVMLQQGGGVDSRAALRHQPRASSSGQGLQSTSPSPSAGLRATRAVREPPAAAAMTEQALRGSRVTGAVQNGWTTRARFPSSDVFTFANSDTEAYTSPAPHRYIRLINLISSVVLCLTHYSYAV